jgi:hypothetical protein
MSELVECHSDYAYEERPIALIWDGQRLEIVSILAEWRTPENKCFRVLTSNGLEFELSYREATNDWHIYQP